MLPFRKPRRACTAKRRQYAADRLGIEALESRHLLTATTAVLTGDWDSPATWSNGVPDDTLRAIIPSGVEVTLTGTDHVAEEIVIQGVLDVEESPGITKRLTADWIHVNSGGVFQIGTELDRYDENDFIITITGQGTNTSFQIEGVPGTLNNNNAFLMAAGGGRLQFFGEEKLTFSKLAQTAEIGGNQIVVELQIDRDHDGDTNFDDGSVNWEVGDQIVIASSSREYDEEEVRTITDLVHQDDATVLITLDAPLAYRHYGEIERYTRDGVRGDFNGDGIVNAADYTVWRDHLGAETDNPLGGLGDGVPGVGAGDHDAWRDNYGATAGPDFRTWEVDMRAEVALLSRNVRFEGLASQDTDNQFGDRARFNAGIADGFGAHTMIMPTAGQITIDSVQFDRMGQTARQGRYPVHWHIAGDRTGDILRGASITNSNNRGVTVHGTHNLLIEDNVLHDIHGHGFFIEDAVETGNQFLVNIAFGIHKVGRSEAVGDFAPDLNDPFIVDTHDHVGQNGNRFLSSAAYWITNPDNTFVGNISAGSEGTGFWFILPDRPIGAAANDPQYNGVRPDRTNLGQFDHNSSHASPVGLNFDRGSDLEVPVGGNIKAFFDGDEWRPPQEPQINYYTGYQHRIGNYHRGQIANFHENRYVDNFTSTFITFTQRVTDTLYVGHSRGNADPSEIVTGHTIYDGASTLTGNHFAGFTASNAHTFRTHNAANRFTSHLASGTSFEDDGTANAISIAAQAGTLDGGTFGSHNVFGHSATAIYDVDGTLTGHVGGGPGYTVVTDHPFFYDSNDIRPAGWNAVVSDELYAQVLFNIGANFVLTSPDGDAGSPTYSNLNTHVKANDGDYAVSFPGGIGSVSSGFRLKYLQRVGQNDGSTVFRFEGAGNRLAPSGVPRAGSVAAMRSATGTTYAVDGNDLWVKFFSSPNDVSFNTVAGQTDVLWDDSNPLSGDSNGNSGFNVNTVDGLAATGDATRGSVGQVILTGNTRYGNISPGELPIASQYRGTGYELRFDYFVPVNTTLDAPDSLYGQINFNGNNTDSAGFVGQNVAGSGWNTITVTGTVPGNANNAQPFIILADGGFGAFPPNGNGSGTAFYIDNLTLTVGLPGNSLITQAAASAASLTASSDTTETSGSLVTQRPSYSNSGRLALLIEESTGVPTPSAHDEVLALFREEETEDRSDSTLDEQGEAFARFGREGLVV